jgi:virginiamycin B lyase
MRADVRVWLVFAAVGFFGCAEGGTDEPERKVPRQALGSAGNNPAGGTSAYAGSGNVGSAGQSAKGGTAPSLGGGAGGAGGGAGANAAHAGTDNSLAGGAAGAKAGSTADCPSPRRVRLLNDACVDRIEEFSVAKSPTSIVTGSDGQVWFDDDGSNQLVQLDAEGRVVKRVDCGQGSSPRALVGGRDDALVWYTNARAKTLVRQTQTASTTIALDFTATAIALGRDDQLWVTEADKALYQVRPSLSIVAFPDAPSHAVVLGPDQNVWFSAGAVIARLIPARGTQYFTTGESLADELCVGPDGALWFTDGTRHQIGRMDLDGKAQTFDLPFGSGPTRIIAGPDGALWFTESGGDKIGRITVKGDITEYPIPTLGGLPYALTVGGDGNIWFTEKSSGKIGRLLTGPQ